MSEDTKPTKKTHFFFTKESFTTVECEDSEVADMAKVNKDTEYVLRAADSKKVWFKAVVALLMLLLSISAKAQLYSQPTYLTVGTNTPIIFTNYATLVVPTISVAITGMTNGGTQFSNMLYQSLWATGSNAFTTTNITFNAGGNTANTNIVFSSTTYVIPVYTYFGAIPQTPGSNTVFIK